MRIVIEMSESDAQNLLDAIDCMNDRSYQRFCQDLADALLYDIGNRALGNEIEHYLSTVIEAHVEQRNK